MKTKRIPYAGHDDEGSRKKIETGEGFAENECDRKTIPGDELEAIRRWVYEGKR
jgi:hypothetical protein